MTSFGTSTATDNSSDQILDVNEFDTEKSQVLFVDDKETSRNIFKNVLSDEESFGCEIICPANFQEFERLALTQSFDGLLLDKNLGYWTNGSAPFYFNNRKIKTGEDIRNVYRTLLPEVPATDFTTMPTLLSEVNFVSKLGGKIEPGEIVRKFGHHMKEINDARLYFERIQPNLSGETPVSKLRKYRAFSNVFKRWIDYAFEKTENVYWKILYNRKVVRYGTLDSNEHDNTTINSIPVINNYPNYYNSNPENQGFEPMFYWNTSNNEILSKQFDIGNLIRIPLHLQEQFSVCMVPSLKKLYFEDDRKKAIEFARSLTPSSKVEFVKGIFKELIAPQERLEFNSLCEAFHLPVIISVFEGRLEEIEGDHTGWVKLTDIHSSRKFSEPFELRLLNEYGVEFIKALFEYTVYKSDPSSSGSSIVPIEETWE